MNCKYTYIMFVNLLTFVLIGLILTLSNNPPEI